jgi:hypothetical protein
MQQQAAHRPCLPSGYRFNPTPEELIRCYLNPWVADGKTAVLFNGTVCVADIYDTDPDALTSRFQDSSHDGAWYFLCVVRWKYGKPGTRMNRRIRGGGTWSASSSKKTVVGEGHRQGYEYRATGDEKTVWIMEEFVTNLEAATVDDGVKVLCKVYHSPLASAMADQEQEQETKNMAVRSKKRPKLLAQGEYDVERSYIASTSHQGGLLGAAADAGVKMASLDGERSLAAYSVPVEPSPDSYYAGASQGAPESAAADAGVEMARWLNGEHSLAAFPVSVAPSPDSYYAGALSNTWQQRMTEQGMGVDGGLGTIVGDPLEVAVGIADMKGLPDMEGLPLPSMEYTLDVDDDEWLNSIHFYDEDAHNGVEGGDGPVAET